MSFWKSLTRLVAVSIFTPVVFLLGCQSRLIYHPRAYGEGHEAMLRRAGGQRLLFQTPQGRQAAFYIPPQGGGAGMPQAVWLLFGGNAALALDWLPLIEGWDRRQAFLLVDYPGYGGCEGRASPSAIRENTKAALAALADHLQVETGALQPRLAVLGHSLGAAAALMAAEDLEIRRGVLVSPFTSMTDMGRLVLGWPLCHLNLHRFDNRRTLKAAAARDARLVIFHGAEDEIIPVRMGRELAAAAPDAVVFHEVPGARHNDILHLVAGRIGAEMARLTPSER